MLLLVRHVAGALALAVELLACLLALMVEVQPSPLVGLELHQAVSLIVFLLVVRVERALEVLELL